MSTDDGCTLESSKGSMTMRPALSSSRMVASDRITLGSLPAGLGIFGGPRGCSSEAEHQLPKLRTRVRFPSPALGFRALDGARATSVPVGLGAPAHLVYAGGVRDDAPAQQLGKCSPPRFRPVPGSLHGRQ